MNVFMAPVGIGSRCMIRIRPQDSLDNFAILTQDAAISKLPRSCYDSSFRDDAEIPRASA
jgi:hypothetical protein